jgi:hypothetical protein
MARATYVIGGRFAICIKDSVQPANEVVQAFPVFDLILVPLVR